MRTYDEHMTLSKQRALEYLDRGEVVQAITSMLSDLSKHDETRGIGEKMAPLGLMAAWNRDPIEARRFIVGFR